MGEMKNSATDAAKLTAAPGSDACSETASDSNASGGDAVARARLQVARAYAWRAENPHGWQVMADVWDGDVKAQRRTSGQRAIERVRSLELADVNGCAVRISHDLRAPLERIYQLEHPEAVPYFEHRRALVDCLPEFGGGA